MKYQFIWLLSLTAVYASSKIKRSNSVDQFVEKSKEESFENNQKIDEKPKYFLYLFRSESDSLCAELFFGDKNISSDSKELQKKFTHYLETQEKIEEIDSNAMGNKPKKMPEVHQNLFSVLNILYNFDIQNKIYELRKVNLKQSNIFDENGLNEQVAFDLNISTKENNEENNEEIKKKIKQVKKTFKEVDVGEKGFTVDKFFDTRFVASNFYQDSLGIIENERDRYTPYIVVLKKGEDHYVLFQNPQRKSFSENDKTANQEKEYLSDMAYNFRGSQGGDSVLDSLYKGEDKNIRKAEYDNAIKYIKFLNESGKTKEKGQYNDPRFCLIGDKTIRTIENYVDKLAGNGNLYFVVLEGSGAIAQYCAYYFKNKKQKKNIRVVTVNAYKVFGESFAEDFNKTLGSNALSITFADEPFFGVLKKPEGEVKEKVITALGDLLKMPFVAGKWIKDKFMNTVICDEFFYDVGVPLYLKRHNTSLTQRGYVDYPMFFKHYKNHILNEFHAQSKLLLKSLIERNEHKTNTPYDDYKITNEIAIEPPYSFEYVKDNYIEVEGKFYDYLEALEEIRKKNNEETTRQCDRYIEHHKPQRAWRGWGSQKKPGSSKDVIKLSQYDLIRVAADFTKTNKK